MNDQAVLYVQDLARILGRTESAIRTAVSRGGADWLPPRLATRRISWRRETVDAFLRSLETAPPETAPKRGVREVRDSATGDRR